MLATGWPRLPGVANRRLRRFAWLGPADRRRDLVAPHRDGPRGRGHSLREQGGRRRVARRPGLASRRITRPSTAALAINVPSGEYATKRTSLPCDGKSWGIGFPLAASHRAIVWLVGAATIFPSGESDSGLSPQEPGCGHFASATLFSRCALRLGGGVYTVRG
jgi:hypothetical protein